jgi:hypothetical protein
MNTLVDKADATAAVEGFTSSWLAHDIDRKAAFLTGDFVLWNNCDHIEVPHAPAIKSFRWLTTVTRNNQYYDVRRNLTSFGVVQQHLASFDTDQGNFRGIPMLLVFHTRGRRVSRCETYLDSTGLPKLEWPKGVRFF